VGKRSKGRQKRRGPSRALAVDTEKRPAISHGPDFNEQRPRWSFAYIDIPGHFGWGHLTAEAAENLVQCLAKWETMTWGEIIGRGSHFIDKPRCSKEARDRLKHLQLDDVDKLLSLRVNSRSRVFGIVRDGVFHFLWWDPDHLVCPSNLKGT